MTQRNRGGQPKPAAERKRNNLTFRVRDNLKSQLQASADENQRSLSKEIECRLERSFVDTIGDQIAARVVDALRLYLQPHNTPPWPLPGNMADYCVTCDGVHDPERHARLADMFARI